MKISSPLSAPLKSTEMSKNYLGIFLLICTLFFLWGCSTGLLDNLNKHFQNSLHLSKFRSGFIQNAYYLGYFFMALPAGYLARLWGYKGGILMGLALVTLGALWFVIAVKINTYLVFLIGLFILASGFATLETVANPLANNLGSLDKSTVRINIAQTCCGVGIVLGMFFGSLILLSNTLTLNTDNHVLLIPYLALAFATAILFCIFAFTRMPVIQVETVNSTAVARPLTQQKHFVFGALAQFLYVAAQTGIFSYFINYAVATNHFSDQFSGKLQAFAFILFTLGRLGGSILMNFIKPYIVLFLFSCINIVLMILVIGHWGPTIGLISLISSFFFMSIMFPTIFSLSINGLGFRTKVASSVIIMMIVGGAIMTPIMGWIADKFSMNMGFIIPLFCFIYIAYYSKIWNQLSS